MPPKKVACVDCMLIDVLTINIASKVIQKWGSHCGVIVAHSPGKWEFLVQSPVQDRFLCHYIYIYIYIYTKMYIYMKHVAWSIQWTEAIAILTTPGYYPIVNILCVAFFLGAIFSSPTETIVLSKNTWPDKCFI